MTGVPLLELYPLRDGPREERIAVALDHCRFFHEHLWWPWDENDDECEDWVSLCCTANLQSHLPDGL